MATLSGNKIKDTYQSLIKLTDNGNLTTGAKRITDGFGNNSPLFLSTTQIGVGVTPTVQFHASGDGKFGGNLTVTGNLVVEGSLTTVGTDTLTVKDPLIVLANNNTSADAVDIGFYGKYHPSSTTLFAGLFRDESDDKFKLFKSLQVEPTTTVNTSGTGYAAATLVADVEGTLTGIIASTTTATTQSQNDNSTKIATTAYVDTAIDGVDTLAEILAIGNTTGGTDIAVGAGDDITFTSSSKIFMNGTKLQIYNTGNDSFIEHTFSNTGSLNLLGDSIKLKNATNNETYIVCTDNSSVDLYHNDSKKFETTSTGVSVTGSITTNTGSGSAILGSHLGLGDNQKARFGAGQDLQIYHNGTDSIIENATGHVNIINFSDDKDILFQSDDGSGGITTYFFLDGSTVMNRFVQHVQLDDNIELRLGTNQDLRLEHTGSEGTITNFTGNLTIQNTTDDADILFKSDDGSGGTALYFQIDGSAELNKFIKNSKHPDSIKAIFGDSNDLQIYHDGGDSHIINTTGDLTIDSQGDDLLLKAADDFLVQVQSSEIAIQAVGNGKVGLRYDNVEKFETTSTGISVIGSILASGDVKADTHFTSSDTSVALSTNSNGTIFLRPNGRSSTTAQSTFTTSLASIGTNATFAGNVGIGTSSPDRKLHVNSSTTNIVATFESTDATAAISLQDNSTTNDSKVQVRAIGDDFNIVAGGTQRLTILNTGNVGIGETNPAVPLHITRDSASGENIALLLDNNNTTAGNEIGLLFRSMVGSTNTDFEIFGKANGANDMDLVFESDGSNERVRFTADGNVGIGTSSPSTRLEVAASATTNVDIAHFSNSNSVEKAIFKLNSLGAGQLVLRDAGNAEDVLISSHGDSYFNGGNVGIGTASPSAKLHIETGTDEGIRIHRTSLNANFGAIEFRNSDDSATNSRIGYNSNELRLEATSTQRFVTNGSDALVIDSSQNALFAGNVDLADSKKIQVGASQDLKIYHDGSHSYIQDSGTGVLKILSSGVGFQNEAGSLNTLVLDSSGNATFAGVVTAPEFSANVNNSAALRMKSTTSTIGYGVTNADLVTWSLGGVHPSGYFFRTTGANPALQISANGDATFAGTVNIGGNCELGANNINLADNGRARFGNSTDLQIYHDGTNSNIDNQGGNLIIINRTDDADIKFQCDDGSGGLDEYFRIDGSSAINIFSKSVRLFDDVQLQVGAGQDLKIFHDATNSEIRNQTGDLTIRNDSDDKDIIFKSDDGSGGVTTYMFLDGSLKKTQFWQSTRHIDNVFATFGVSDDLQIFHNGGDSVIKNQTGDLFIENTADDKDIIFKSDNGSGGTENYIQIDGSEGRTTINKPLRINDSVELQIGSSADLKIFHTGSVTSFDNFTGNLQFVQAADDADIIFQCDDGSGGLANYITIDGSDVITKIHKNFRYLDSVFATFGNGDDFQLFHDGSASTIRNYTGNLIIENNTNDADIIFKSDDGSGGTTEYFRLDGGLVNGTTTLGAVNFPDKSKIFIGTGNDLRIYHNGTDSVFENVNGHLFIQNYADDKDIVFQSDDGSGGIAQYYRVDGGANLNVFSKDIFLTDNVKALFGDSSDLKIYHDGSNSFVQDAGTGALFLEGNSEVRIRKSGTSEIMLQCVADGAVNLYHNNSKRFETASIGAIVDNMLKITIDDINTGEDRGLQLYNENSSGQQWNITAGRAGIENTSFVVRDSSNNVDALIINEQVAGTTPLITVANGGATTFAGKIIAGGGVQFTGGTIATATAVLHTNNVVYFRGGSSGLFLQNADGSEGMFMANDHIRFETSSTERMRIDSSGNVGIGNTSPQADLHIGSTQSVHSDFTSAFGSSKFFVHNGNNGGGAFMQQGTGAPNLILFGKDTGNTAVVFYNSDMNTSQSSVGSITTTSSATAFNTSSDYRLKEDLQDFAGLDMVSKIPVYDFKWKTDRSRGYGVMAHELEQVLPQAVTGEKDAEEMQSVDYSKIVPLLVKSIQELKERIKQLEDK